MIGKIQLLIRLLFIVVINASVGYSQTSFEEKAVSYFCIDIIEQIPLIKDVDIVFKGHTNGRPARIYDVADCLGDINLIKDSIPKRKFLDNLEKELSEMEFNKRKIDVTCSKFKKNLFLKRDFYSMIVYESIQYNERDIVEIFLLNKKRLYVRKHS